MAIKLRIVIAVAMLVVAAAFSAAPAVVAQAEAPDPGDSATDFCDAGASGASGGEPVTNSAYCKDVQTRFTPDGDNVYSDVNSPLIGKNSVIYRVTQLVIIATGIVSVVMIIIGGFRYVVSGGDSNGVSGAKNTILYAVIGLVVVLFAQIIVTFVITKL